MTRARRSVLGAMLLALLLIVALGACKDDGAPAACDSVVDTWCGRFIACFPEATREGCVSTANASMSNQRCQAATAVRSQPELLECREAIDALPCESLRAMPSVCAGLFQY